MKKPIDPFRKIARRTTVWEEEAKEILARVKRNPKEFCSSLQGVAVNPPTYSWREYQSKDGEYKLWVVK